MLVLCLSGAIIPSFSQSPIEKSELLRADKPLHGSLRFEQLTVGDGLSSQTAVYAILQDRQGFIWIGSWAGLNRYDGYSFTHFKNIPFDSTSIASNIIFFGIYEDRSGALWVSNTTGELNRLDPVTGNFTHWKHIPGDSTSLSSGYVTSILESRSGDLWVGSNGIQLRGTGGLNRMDRSRGSFTRFLHDPDDPASLSNNIVEDLYEDEQGILWISTANGLNRMDTKTGRLTRFLYGAGEPDGYAEDPSYRFKRFQVDVRDSAMVWIGSDRGFVYFNTQSGDYTRYLFDSPDPAANFVTGLVHDPGDENVLWISTNGSGLFRLDTQTSRTINYRHEPGNPNSLSSDGLHRIYADRTGIIWLCAQDDGVIRFDPSVAGIAHYGVLPGQTNSLSKGMVQGLMEDRTGALWVGLWAVEEGLNRIDRKTGHVTRWKIPSVTSIVEDQSGVIWIGSSNIGLNRWDPVTKTFTAFRHRRGDSTSLSQDFVETIYEDRNGSLWVGTLDGLNRMEPSTGTFERFMHNPEDPTSISSELVTSIYEDHAGVLWVGTFRGGLNRMDRTTGKFTHYLYDPHRPGTLSSNAVWSLCEREREPGILWIGTAGGGLNRFDTRTGTFEYFTEENGLPNNFVWGILEGEQGYLWLSTTGGLSRFDPETRTFRTFASGSGLPSVEFKNLAYTKSKSGELFFGGVNGLFAFYPEKMQENLLPPQVTLTGIRLFNKPVVAGESAILKQPIAMTEEVRLEHDQNSITFDYVALHYRNPAKNRYAFILEGFDRDWVQAGTQRTATYTNLPPGSYAFRVKASNSDGIWNEEGTSIRMTILPPWWRTAWAYVLFSLFIASAAATTFRSQRNRLLRNEREKANQREIEHAREIECAYHQLEEQANLLREMDRVKGRFFANISHEFRTPITLLLAPLHDALDSDEDHPRLSRRQLSLMHRNGERLLRLINQLLDLSRIEAGSMQLHAREADLVAFLRGVVLAFAARAEREQITLSFQSEQSPIPLYYDAEKLERVFFNLISNALKFTTTGGKVRVSVALVLQEGRAMAEVVVKDTGEGIPSEKLALVFDRFYQVDPSSIRRHEGTGIGLALAKELVELHGGTITVESEVGFGSSFTVRLPLGKEHLRQEDIVHGPEEEPDVPIASGDAVPIEENLVGVDPVDVEIPSNAPLVLIVEDNVDVCSYIRSKLCNRYRIEEARDGLEGLEQIRRLHPDLVISDVMMPRLDGFALCRAIKTDQQLNHVPVILLTAKADESNKLEGLSCGADDYLMKPFSARELLVRVENLIEIRQMLRKRFSGEVRLGPTPVTVPSADALFLDRLREVVEAQMGESTFGVERLAEEAGLSTRQLHRRVKELTGLTSVGYIRMMRMERAAQLLQQRAGNISEVAHATGYGDVSYFARLFSQSFGVTPSEFVTSNNPINQS